ncbi:MAG: helix-turn-helix domain-containing protein [Nostoc indistinguendum CM1-VF10]|nr:helix-turn-helix domain-containing protein [Nostoc indistinguendum CM1-VF10]
MIRFYLLFDSIKRTEEPIFKAKIYPTNEQKTCISQNIGCKFMDMLI